MFPEVVGASLGYGVGGFAYGEGLVAFAGQGVSDGFECYFEDLVLGCVGG